MFPAFMSLVGSAVQTSPAKKSQAAAAAAKGIPVARSASPRLKAGLLTASVLLAGLFSPNRGLAQVNVTTYHNDIGRTGQNLSETTLNTTNVNATTFGKLFSQPVDGQIYAQPLYLSGLTIGGAVHNVVFVATENDSVYAFDADSNGGASAAPLWKDSMLSTAHGAAAGATTVASSVVGYDIQPQIGITGTPVIDATTGTLYVVGKTMEGGNAVQRLHALDVTSGAEKFGGPVVLTASVPGTGNGSVNGTLTFDPLWESNRPGLLLLNGIVYIGFAAHGDNGPWHGWILGYNAGTLKQTGAYCATPNGTGAGFWMSGQGLPADQLDPVNKPFGRIFVPTGNGDYTATKPYTNNMDYGDSHLALDLTNGAPTVSDEFTTLQQQTLDNEDGDIASGGLMVIPTQSGTYPNLAVQVGKGGTMYLLNRDNLGGYNTSADQVLQEQAYSVGNVGAWSSPAYWNGTVYWWGRVDSLKSFKLANGLLATTPVKSSDTMGFPGATPSISANGSTQGIVWAIDSEAYATPGPSILSAHDATNVATQLYSSSTNTARDMAGNAVKFTVPTVVNGKVYVGTAGEVDIYGLLNGATQTAAPLLSPGTESFTGTITVTITDNTAGSTIYYTIDGSAPTTSSTVYTGPLTVSSSETIKAIASASGQLLSAQSSATYSSTTQAANVVFSLPTGTYTSAQSLTLTDSTAGSSIYYNIGTATPTSASTLYTGPIAINSTETITAVGVAPGVSNSPPLSNTYTLNSAATGPNYTAGFANSSATLMLNGSTQLNDTRLQLTNGNTGQAGTAWYGTPVNIQSFTNDFTFQLSNPVANGITFTIQNASQKYSALGANGSSLGYAPITNSIAVKFDFYTTVGTGQSSTGLYTNGAAPTTPAIDLLPSGINLRSDDEMAVHMVYNGTVLSMTITDMVTSAIYTGSWTINIPTTVGGNTAYVGFTGATGGYSASQKILTWSFVSSASSSTTATPAFTPVAGTYTSAQNVSISDATSGATIYYTTNGTTPTTSSAVYSSPITVSASETIQAIAAVSGSSSSPASAVASAAYVISTQAATPTFSVAGGTYTSAQSVAISDATSGATIYYTTNGTTPTTASTKYTGAITVSASETLEAIAVATGFTNSPVASAAYTITTQAATPAFSVAGGTYTSAQTVAISDATSGATIYYTTNGTTPTTSSTKYTGSITVSATETIEAIAVATGHSNSAVASATYTINSAASGPSYNSGFASSNGAVFLHGSAKLSGPRLQLTTGLQSQAGEAWFLTRQNVQSFTNDFTFQLTSAVANGFTFAIQNSPQATSAGGSAGSSLGYAPIPNSVAIKFDFYSVVGTGSSSTGLYLNGASPTTPATDMLPSGIKLASGDQMAVHMAYDGTTLTMTVTDTATAAVFTNSWAVNIPTTIGSNTAYVGFTGATGSKTALQEILTWSFASSAASPTAATPAFSPAAGSYTSAQSVTISDTTSGASIYYTTNGTTPTTSSTKYTGPINVASTEGIQAIAVASGYTNSSVSSAAYTISSATAATPTFSPAGGSYTSAQSVTISDATSGASIYYTTNGTTPTTSSTKYTGAINVASTESIQAIAVATGYTNSAVASAAYTITSGNVTATPTFVQAPGTYSSSVNVQILDSTSGAVIYFTVDGSTPTTSSNVYSGYIAVSATETVKAIAVKPGYSASGVLSGAYTIAPFAAFPAISPGGGTYSSPLTVTITDATPGAVIHYTIDQSTPTASSPVYTGAFTLTGAAYVQAIAVATGYTNSYVASANYNVTP